MPSIPEIQRAAWRFLWDKANPQNGLVPDHIDQNGIVVSPATIAATGMMLSALLVGVENGWVSRAEGVERALITLRFFARDAAQHGGFFFHFLDMESGERVWNCEVSSIDSTFIFLGALFCEAYFDGKSRGESEIRELADEIWERADWNFFRGEHDAVSIAYTPEKGLSKHRWHGWSEALPLAVLGLGSSSHPLPIESYAAWTQSYKFKRLYGRDFLFHGPLFTHLFPHLWLDLRGQSDAVMRERGFDYFENTRRAVQIQSDWAKKRGDARKWGVSACDAPQNGTLGGYRARGVPFGKLDGVFSPPVCLAALPFAPDLTLESWEFWHKKHPEIAGNWGVRGAVHDESGWIGGYFGLDQGMLVLMLENWRSGLLWELSRSVKPLQIGLKRAGFR